MKASHPRPDSRDWRGGFRIEPDNIPPDKASVGPAALAHRIHNSLRKGLEAGMDGIAVPHSLGSAVEPKA